MSRTHKDRHKWKSKERKQTKKDDPEKIKLHRKRFIERLESREKIRTGYGSIVFRLRLEFRPQEQVTELKLDHNTIGTLPFLIEDTEACHYRIYAEKPDFNVSREEERLIKHVSRARHFGDACFLEQKSEETIVCTSVISCPFRKWDTDREMPVCTK